MNIRFYIPDLAMFTKAVIQEGGTYDYMASEIDWNNI